MNLESPPAAAVKLEDIKASLEQHKPAALFLCQVTTVIFTLNDDSNDKCVMLWCPFISFSAKSALKSKCSPVATLNLVCFQP